MLYIYGSRDMENDMSYLDSETFKEKAKEFQKKAIAQREAAERQRFDAETAETESVSNPEDFLKKLAEEE